MSPEGEKRKRLEDKLRRELGARVVTLLEGVEDVLLNADGRLWVKRTGSDYCEGGSLDAALAKSAMGTIASMQGTEITHDWPILETELPIWGARFDALIEPVAKGPVFAIRQRATRIFTLSDYEESGALTRKEGSLEKIVG
jgi:type IV secretion system protein VirB11